ncbi:MAG: hypothetical protein FK733_09860 [Asgard group archaeon]|nr:hypothetical protein [Asgard group archaeon]
MVNYILKIKQKLLQAKLFLIIVLFVIAYFQSSNIQSQIFSNKQTLNQQSELIDYNITDTAWSNTTRVSEKDGYGSYNPEIASDNAGNLYVVWDDESVDDYGILYRAFLNRNASWTSIQTISEENTFSIYPRITTDKNNYIHISWWDSTGTDELLLYKYYNGNRWSEVIEVNACDDAWASHEILSTNNGSVYFFWIEREENCSLLFFRSYLLLTNELTQKISITDCNTWADSPSATVDTLYNIHLVWEAKNEEMLAYEIYYKTLAGYNWQTTEPVIISKLDDLSDKNPTVKADSKDSLHVVWDQKGEIHYCFMSDNVWTSELKISGFGWALTVDLAIDKRDNLHFTWEESTWLMYKQFNQETGWSNNVNLTDFFSIIFSPKIAADTFGSVHIVWNDCTIDSMWEVYNIKGQISYLDKQTIILITTIIVPLVLGNIAVLIIVTIKRKETAIIE